MSNAEENKLKLIEYDETGKENLWRLPITCNVEIFSELESLHTQILAPKNDPSIPPPSREILNRGCHKMREQYRSGLFASYHERHPNQYWPWATEYYTEYRDKCLFVLEYAAKQEWTYAMKNKHKPDVLHASIRQTALLYSWVLEVALGLIPNLAYAEKAVGICIKLYRNVGDRSTARSVFQTYIAFMKERNDTWEPSAKISEIWPEATSQADHPS